MLKIKKIPELNHSYLTFICIVVTKSSGLLSDKEIYEPENDFWQLWACMKHETAITNEDYIQRD